MHAEMSSHPHWRLTMRTARLVIGVALLGLIIGGCAKETPQNTATASSQPSATLRPVTVAQFGDLLLYLPLYIAKEEGLFAREGLDVRIVSTGGDDKTFAAVLSGDAAFGIADPTFVAIAAERQQRGKVIAQLIDGMPNYGVAAKTSAATITKAADLSGKTVATVPAPSTSYALMEQMYKSAGLKPQIRQIAFPGLVPAIETGQADYALLIEPWVTQVEQKGGKVAFSLMDYYPHFALTGVTTSDAQLQKDPEIATKFTKALTEAVRVFYDDPAAALRAAKTRFPQETDEVLRRAVERARTSKIYPRCLAVTEAAWTPAIQLRRQLGDLQRDPAPMADYVENKFAQTACSPK